jgi:peptidoglycan-associated lipoprotein
MKNSILVLTAVLALAVAACTKNTIPDPEVDTSTAAGSSSGADTGSYGSSGMGAGEAVENDLMTDGLDMIIYFDFDQSDVRPEYNDLLSRHATYIANNPRINARLEGHADERGSREYNIGLGERRAQAVRRILLIQGAPANQISTVSFGEERPAAFGSDEESYALNRRVEIKYTNK